MILKKVIETIGIKKASKWLENTGFNREMGSRMAKLYAEEMKKGQWVTGIGEPIVFNKEGKLVNGANRLMAVLLLCQENSKFCVKMEVARDVDPIILSKIDTNIKVRSQKERMEMLLKKSIKPTHAVITKTISETGIGNEFLTAEEMVKLYTKIEPFLPLVDKLIGKPIFGKAAFISGVVVASMNLKDGYQAVENVVKTLAKNKTAKRSGLSSIAIDLIERKNKCLGQLTMTYQDGVTTTQKPLTKKQLYNLAQYLIKVEHDKLAGKPTNPFDMINCTKTTYKVPSSIEVTRQPLSDTFEKLTNTDIASLVAQQSKRQYMQTNQEKAANGMGQKNG